MWVLNANPYYEGRDQMVIDSIPEIRRDVIFPVIQVFYLPQVSPHARAFQVVGFPSGLPDPIQLIKGLEKMAADGTERIGEIRLVVPLWLLCTVPTHAGKICECPEGNALAACDIKDRRVKTFFYTSEKIAPDSWERAYRLSTGPFDLDPGFFETLNSVRPAHLSALNHFMESIK